MKLTFSRGHYTNMQIGNESFAFKIRLRVNKKFQIHKNFIKVNVNVCLLFAHNVMTSIILHTRITNCQYNVCYAHGFYVSADFHFSHFEKLKSTFFTSIHNAQRVMY